MPVLVGIVISDTHTIICTVGYIVVVIYVIERFGIIVIIVRCMLGGIVV